MKIDELEAICEKQVVTADDLEARINLAEKPAKVVYPSLNVWTYLTAKYGHVNLDASNNIVRHHFVGGHLGAVAEDC